MNAYISYSIHQEESHIIPLLSASLGDKGLFPYSRDWNGIDLAEEAAIGNFQIFIGIITNRTFAQKVLEEFHLFSEANLPSILFIEDVLADVKIEDTNTIIFSRTHSRKALENLWLLKNLKSSQENFLNHIAIFIGGVVLEFLNHALAPLDQRNYHAKLNSVHVVEERLKQLNEARFEELCDVFLAYRYPEIKLFLRQGSQKGVQKTIKGTPDSLLQLPNGSFILVEVTTQKQGLLKKVLKDIDKVSDEQKTGIPISKIWKLIICTNRTLDNSIITQIEDHAKTNQILTVEIFTLERLSAEIYLHHQDLAKDYLELFVDSGQVVSIKDFIRVYNTSGHSIATPLDNPFYHRSHELANLVAAMESDKLILISGPAGVGKTKLALEGIKVFTEKHIEYQSYSVQNKDADILEDLYGHFKKGSKSVLFIDDVNRFDRINSVVGFFRSTLDINLKIVLTTRDYGLLHIQNVLSDLNFTHLKVSKFKDEELLDIVKSEPFKVTNSEYQDKILAISDGNVRLALMATRLAIDKQDIRALSDVSDLLDKYFGSFTKDEKVFTDKTLLKSIGIICFFYTFPYSNNSVLEETATNFNISRTELLDSINTLEGLEFLEINFNHAKIADQTLATYYFYKVFVHGKLLSFYRLLKLYFANSQERFTDSFYPVVNSFGFEKVKDMVQSDLKRYYNEIRDQSDGLIISFLKAFHFYLQEETLDLVLQQTKTLPESNKPLNTNYSSEKNNYRTNDEYLDLLEYFYQTDIYLREGLEISFEYVKKKPESLRELLKNIVQNLTFDKEDHYNGYNRQMILFDLFKAKCGQGDSVYVESFLAIVHEFLEFAFQHSKGGRGNKIKIYTFPFQLTEKSKIARNTIWETVELLFPKYEAEVLSILQKHASRKPDVEKKVMEFDLEFLIPFIQKNLSPDIFVHCFYVQKLLAWIKRKNIDLKDSDIIKVKYQNKYYKWYEKLNWDLLKNKEEHEFKDWNEFQRLKEKDIRDFSFFETEEEFMSFIKFFNELKDLAKQESYHFNNSIDIIIEEALKRKPETGITYFQLAVEHFTGKDASLGRAIFLVAQSESTRAAFWKLFEERRVTDYQALTFLSSIPTSAVSASHLRSFYDILRNTTQNIYIYPGHYRNLMVADSGFIEKIGEISLEKNESSHSKISLDRNYFEVLSANLRNPALLKKVYLQQNKLQDHFDFSGDALFKILLIDSSFIIEYLNFILVIEGPHFHDSEKKTLGEIWNLPDHNEILDKIFETLTSYDSLFPSNENIANAFFKNTDPEKDDIANQYIFDFIKRFSESAKKMDIIFDVIHHSRHSIFREAFHLYLHHNSKVEDFSHINWIDKQSVFSGDVIIGDLKAAQWRNLLQLVEEANLGLDGFSIIKYIKDQIDNEKRYGDWEREKKFLSRRW